MSIRRRVKAANPDSTSGPARKRSHRAPLGAADLSEEEDPEAVKALLRGCQAEKAGKGVWNAEQQDRD